MLDAILMPERMEPVAREFLQPRLVARMWPPEVASKPFVDFLKGQYDHTQLQAIEVGYGPAFSVVFTPRNMTVPVRKPSQCQVFKNDDNEQYEHDLQQLDVTALLG